MIIGGLTEQHLREGLVISRSQNLFFKLPVPQTTQPNLCQCQTLTSLPKTNLKCGVVAFKSPSSCFENIRNISNQLNLLQSPFNIHTMQNAKQENFQPYLH